MLRPRKPIIDSSGLLQALLITRSGDMPPAVADAGFAYHESRRRKDPRMNVT
jgi:hypothetical protein